MKTPKNVVTPWEVKGAFDYQKLVKEFGVQPLKELPDGFKDDLLFRRGHVFAHRDLGIIVDAIKNNKPFVMMTGLMPTGKMHIGHMLVVQQMIFYQRLGAICYVTVADVEAYHARGQTLADSRRIAEEYLTAYFALGLDPDSCHVYFQSDRSKDAEESNAYYRLQNLLAGHATLNEFKAIYGEVHPGKITAALLQAADMLHPQLPEFEGKPVPVVVPVGIDQDPHLRLARDLSKRIKGFDFKPLCSTYHRFMPGLSGGKMSSSDPHSYIALTDDPATVKQKINKYAFSGGKATLEEHRAQGGDPDIDVSYQYLTYFEEDDKRLKKIYDDYKKGKLLSGELKALAIEKINAFLGEHQKKRNSAKKVALKFLA